MSQDQRQTIDCRGLQCPAPILKIAKAARSLRQSGGLLEIMADDDAFPLDIKSWCRSSRAQLLDIREEKGVYYAQVKIPSKRPISRGTIGPQTAQVSTPPKAPTPKPPKSLQTNAPPSPKSSTSPEGKKIKVDCKGLQCPSPILKIAKASRALKNEGGLLEIIADDDAFPLDLKSWCRSSQSRLLEIKENEDGFWALVEIPPKKGFVEKISENQKHLSSGTKTKLDLGPKIAPSGLISLDQVHSACSLSPEDLERSSQVDIRNVEWEEEPEVLIEVESEEFALPSVKQLDCRGLKCPQPIMKVARAMKKISEGERLKVLADDEAFPLDIQSWARSAKVEIESIETLSTHFRVMIYKPKPEPELEDPFKPPTLSSEHSACDISFASPSPSMASPQKWSALQQPSINILQSHTDESSPKGTRRKTVQRSDQQRRLEIPEVDLCSATDQNIDAQLESLHKYCGVVKRVVILAEASTFNLALVQWCAQHGHHLIALDTYRRPMRAEVALAECLKPSEEKREKCALLVLHNDYESLMAALLVANGAASQGMDVIIFFSFWGVNLLRGYRLKDEVAASKRSWLSNFFRTMPKRPKTALVPTNKPTLVQRIFKWLMPKGPREQVLGQFHFGGLGKSILQKIMKKKNIMTLPEMLEAAADQKIRFVVCTMSMSVMGIQKEDLMDLPNLELGGVTVFVEESRNAKISLVF